MSFSDLGLLPELLRAVADKGYDSPSPIQIQAIPAVLSGRDVLAGSLDGDSDHRPAHKAAAKRRGKVTQDEQNLERRVLEQVSTEVDHMRSTLDALLRIALAETGTVAREPVDLSELVASVVELYAPVSEERGIELESSVAAGAAVLGSRQLLAQALANLLDNAIKFTPDGGHIRVLLRGSSSEPEVIVEDNGPGIPADKREIVLGRRVRLDEARKFPGSGLGLSLVAAVTKLHGARLVLDDAGPGLRVSLKF